MDLTPIKTRGKRRRLDESPAASSIKRVKTKPKSKRDAKPTLEAKVSILEKKLPLEVMEQIFWLSSNCNLPRASPLIGRLLSGRSTLQMIFIRAFEPTWDAEWDVHGMGTGRGIVGDPSFQSEVLECSWATIDLILECWVIFVRRRAQKYEAQKKTGEESLHFFHWVSSLDRNFTKSERVNCLLNPQKMTQLFHGDYAAFRRAEHQETPEPSGHPFLIEPLMTSYIHVHRYTRIPDSLFAPPWNEDSLQKLFWLLRSGAQLADDQTWELTLQAFHHAVPLELPDNGQVNLTIVRMLALLEVFEEWPKHILSQERSRIDHSSMPIEGGWKKYILLKLEGRDASNPSPYPR
ncbi:hypothetical protein GGR53DRAFT_509143, partial [Hypoxylon sp. FL1150]